MERYFTKKIKNPFSNNEIVVYADMLSASFFNNQNLLFIVEGIRSKNESDIGNEDNDITLFIRVLNPNSFRITYRLSDNGIIRALVLFFDEKSKVRIFHDPLL